MPRPREFDEIQALGSALDVFRQKGYEAASLMDLLKAMDLSKSSLYNSFGTKHQLFIATIDHFIANNIKHFEDKLAGATTVREGLEATIGACVDRIINHGDFRFCLLQGSISEVLPHDQVAQKHLDRGIDRMTAAFTEFFRRSQANGQIPAHKDPNALATFLVTTYLGLPLTGRVDPTKNHLNTFVDQLVAFVTGK